MLAILPRHRYDWRKRQAAEPVGMDKGGTFETRQACAARSVEARLAHWLSVEMCAGTPARLTEAMRHATLGGGKRFRAFLVLESASVFNAHPDTALDVAAALECVHAYSLVHDDLPAMDNDVLRRGRPTVWKAYDEWTAILAGDALLTLAFEIIAALGPVPAAAKVQIMSQLAIASGRGGMVGGQMLDLEAEKLGLPARPSRQHIARLQALKTGALITFACVAGGLLGNAADAERAALAHYGHALGLAFQISDDLLDAVGDAAVVGKAVGKDAALGKATLVSSLGVEAARQQLVEVVAAAKSALSIFGARAEVLCQAAEFMTQRRT